MALEMFEAYWQRSDTMYGLLSNVYYYYNKSIFFLFLMHPSFYFVLFILLLTDTINIWIVAILLLKGIDIILKVSFARAIFVYNNLDQDILDITKESINPLLFVIGLGLYPPLLYYALT
jgi:hypothetical protein